MCVRTMEMFSLKLKEMWAFFSPVEVVDRGSEAQLKVGENLNEIT